MKARSLFSLVSIVLVSACGLPGPSNVPRAVFAASALQRARSLYFAGIALNARGPGFLGPGELGTYPATANGNVAPAHVIAGEKTGLFEEGGCCVPQSAWFDAADNSVWTCRTFSKFISRFSANSWGNVRPAGRLAISPHTVSCGGVAVTKMGDVVADDVNNAFVATWASGAAGDDRPLRKIAGGATDLFLPSGITFDGQGNYIVADRCSPPACGGKLGGEILTFDARADGNVAPVRVLAGGKTQLSGPDRVAYDPIHNRIYASNLYTSTITAYPATSTGNVAPTISIAGTNTHLWNPDAIAIDDAGYLYVGNEPLVPGPPPASILVFAPGADGNAAPVQIIQGSKTGLAEVDGLSVH
ncbi:MAG: hypothetical protein JO277_02875 [Candidatus Eremiobacteraeota bacterium]|nr:hypothetical protein [Candidatus Eremiobacteraeota bacterium]